MKKLVLFSAVAAMVLASCAGNPEGKKAETTDSVEVANNTTAAGDFYAVDTAASHVMWKGTKVTGAHEGTISIKEGSVSIDNNVLTGGSFVLNMNTISATDLTGEYKDKLDGHLKAEDFFAVATYPEASFTITNVKAGATPNDVVISGNLTIKDKTKNITFDAKVEEVSATSVKTVADFNILREDWGITYEGKKDDLISKEINFKVTLVAKR